MNNGLAVDIGGSHISLAYIDELARSSAIARLDMVSVDESDRWRWITDQILDYAGGCGVDLQNVVISYPGPVSSDGQAGLAPTVSRDLGAASDMIAGLKKALGVPINLINDLACAAMYLGSKRTARRLLVVSVSSGIGAKVYVGEHGGGQVICDSEIAGEIGHLPVNFELHVPCDCGEINHLQSIASGRGIERVAKLDPTLKDVFRHEGFDVRKGINESLIFPAARRGENWATNLVKNCARPLACSLLPAICCLDATEVVIIGGVIAHGGDVYEAAFREALNEMTKGSALGRRFQEVISFERTTNESCLYGALVYSRNLLVACPCS